MVVRSGFSLLCNGNGCSVMEPQILEHVEDFPRKNAVEAEYPLFPCTPLECVGDFLYPTTELRYSQSTFCPLPLSSSTRRMHRELNIYKDSLCSIRSSRGTRQEALRQEKVAFLGKLSQKCPVWRVLRRNSPVLFFFPGAPSVLVGGSLGFWFCA